jgi:predicted DNA binding CopG/RHH family protein
MFDPFKDLVLDPYEQEIEDAMDSGLIKPLINSKKLIEKYTTMAKEDLAKNRNINIRLSEKTLTKLKLKASKMGLGYQTMVGSILHQYANA